MRRYRLEKWFFRPIQIANSDLGERVMSTTVVKRGELSDAKDGSGCSVNNHKSEDLGVLTQRFRNALEKGVAGIIEAGHVLIEAKEQLEHGQFTDWVVRELLFGSRKKGCRDADIRKAEMLMQLARHEVISDASYWHALPPSPRTLWEITQIRPEKRLLKLIRSGKINPGMTREEAIALRLGDGTKGSSKAPALKLQPEVATLVDASILLGHSDCVLAHIRRLKRGRESLPVREFERAARWAKQKLAKQKGAE
jgi:hypothetical protein